MVEHNIADILNVVEVLTLKMLDNLWDDLFLDPNEQKTVLHDLFRDLEMVTEITNWNSLLRILFTLLAVGFGAIVLVAKHRIGAVPRWVDWNGLDVAGVLPVILVLDSISLSEHVILG